MLPLLSDKVEMHKLLVYCWQRSWNVRSNVLEQLRVHWYLMGFLRHLHDFSGAYRVTCPLFIALSLAAIALACAFDIAFSWAVILAAAVVLVLAAVVWFVVLWGMNSIRLLVDHPYDYSFRGSAVRLYDFQVPGRGSVKVLEIDHENAEKVKEGAYVEVGQALAPAMLKMRWGLWVFHGLVRGVMRAEDIDRLLEMLPEIYVDELKDLVSGVRKAVPSKCFLHHWTVRDWFIIQIIPDLEMLVSHINPCQSFLKRLMTDGNERRVRVHRPALGCTALLTQQGFYRNMDWPSLGLMGQFTLLVRRRYLDTGAASVEIGVPGLLGTVTGLIAWNPEHAPENRGMVAMNVCCPQADAKWMEDSKQYLPASYANRVVMGKLVGDSCERSDIDDLSSILAGRQPLAPYHLTFAKFVDGAFSGVMVHCVQDGNLGHAYRRYPHANGDFLLTCNGNFTEACEQEPQPSSFTVHAHDLMHTNDRTAKIRALIATGERDGRNILSQAPINNHETCYMVALEQNVIELRVDNAFGASAEPIDITNALLHTSEQ